MGSPQDIDPNLAHVLSLNYRRALHGEITCAQCISNINAQCNIHSAPADEMHTCNECLTKDGAEMLARRIREALFGGAA